MSTKRSIKSASSASNSTASSTTKGSSHAPKSAAKSRRKASELEKEIILLQDELELVKDQLLQRNESYEQLVKKIIANVDCELYDDVDETTDVFELAIDDVMEMLSSLVTRNYGDEDTIEVRVEELETRVTKQNMDIARLSKQLLLTEYALEDISKSNEMGEVKRLAREAITKLQQTEVVPVAPLSYTQSAGGATIPAPATPRDLILANHEPADPGPKPLKKLPGTTHINDMKPELRYLVIKELSFTRTSGCDWRMFAERVGVSGDVIERLRHMRVQYPMAKVLTTWGESPGATVRMLHRHLNSPQLRWAAVLARHIADTYHVD